MGYPVLYILEADGATPRPVDLSVTADIQAMLDWENSIARAVESSTDVRQLPNVVAYDDVAGWTISTVFLYTRHYDPDMFEPGSLPVLWETMVFAPAEASGSDLDEASTRYTSRADAEAGHRAIVAAVRDAVTNPDSKAEGPDWNPDR